jgi:hypothetical protein
MDGAGEVAPGPGVWVGAGAPGLAGAVAVGVLEGEGVTAGVAGWLPQPASVTGTIAIASAAPGYGRTYGLHGKFNPPWYGSLAWHVPAGQSVAGITGE